MFILAPGHVTPWLSLNQAAHDARESVRAARQIQVAKRQASGAPESDETDYVQIAQHLIKAVDACEKGQDTALQEQMSAIPALMGSRVTVPAPFQPIEGAEALQVRSISLSRAHYSDQAPASWSALAMGDPEPAKVFLSSCLEVQGFDFVGDLKPADLWEEADLLWTLMAIATSYQELSHTEKKLYGSPVAPT